MYRKLFVVGLYCLMTLFFMPHLADAQDQITGPWLWMIAPNGTGQGGAASIDIDSLAVASDGAVTETDIATNSAQEGNIIGNYAWTLGELRTTGIDNTLDFVGEIDNVTDLLKRLGWADGEVLNHSSYALIILESAIARNGVTMKVGSDDAIKVWLNAEVVHTHPVNRGSGGFQDEFQVDLNQGNNLLLVKVSQGWGNWSMFVGVDADVIPKAPNGLSTAVSIENVSSGVYMYWVDIGANKIQRANHDGSNVQDIVTGFGRPVDIALDIAGGKIYWTDRDRADHTDPAGRSSIQRANLDGTNVEILIIDDTPVKENIALDTVGGKMYWTDWNGKLQRANLDGSNVEDIVTGLITPRGVALDISKGEIYWASSIDTTSRKIHRANLDGSNIQEVLTADGAHGIALDVAGNKIYWANWSSGKIQRANLDGSNSEDLVVGIARPFGIALDNRSGRMYWADNLGGKIQRANLDGRNVEDLVTGLTHPIGIALTDTVPPIQTLDTVPTTDTILRLTPASVPSPPVGEQLTLQLNITAGENVAGYQATVNFDPTALRYISSKNADYLPAGAFAIPEITTKNSVTLAATSVDGESAGDGTLATVTFEVVSAKASTVTLSEALLSNIAGISAHPRIVAAKITEPTGFREDVNADGVVNIQDLVLVAANFGATGENAADVNGDGTINIIDLTLVAGALGKTAAAPSVHAAVLEHLTATEVAQWLRAAQQANLTDPAFQRGVEILKHLLTVLVPKETVLLANYPNPFNPETWIPYQLSESADVTVSIYAVDGNLIRTLSLGHKAVGIYQTRSRAAYWDGKNEVGEPVASGVYFYTLTAGDFTATRKMLIRK